MDDAIIHAMTIIYNRIEWNLRSLSDSSVGTMLDDDETISQFKATYNILLRLKKSKPDENNNNWYQLYCRRLGRLVDNHLLLMKDICIELYDDISYVLGETSVRHNHWNWTRFLARMKFEGQLEQRELQMRHSIDRFKKLDDLLFEHNDLLTAYLQKCISLHSKIEIPELIDNIDHLISPISDEKLCRKLKCIEINFNCSNKSLRTLTSPSSNSDQTNNTSDDNYRKFLPSINQLQFTPDTNIWNIERVLSWERWVVILGDPGNAKTTTLRWITRIFAQAILEQKKYDFGPTRVPILIRIGEFAKWCNENPTSSLIDYIGKHTWSQKPYIEQKYAKVLQELVIHGHTLILLDGLDEIPEVRQRQKIVELVRTFIDEYVRAPNFISPFDTSRFEDSISLGIQSPQEFGGNQVIITSRFVGYHLFPLNGQFLKHYLLLSMNNEESNQFVTDWIEQVESSINKIFLEENLPLNRDLRISIKKQYDTLNMLLCNCSKSLISNPLILSIICTSLFNSSVEFIHKCRIQVYDYAVQAALRTWQNKKTNISTEVLLTVLIDLATYLHLKSPSGLIDEHDLRDLCYYTLSQLSLSHRKTELREYTKELMTLLDHQVSIIAERGLQVFGFRHLSFQEYFVTRSLVNFSSIDEIAQRILAFTINSRCREPLLLALGWISWKYSFDEYEKFCEIVVTRNENFVFPFGALLLFDAFEDVQSLPSNRILFAALNSLLDHPLKRISIGYFSRNFAKLDENTQIQWIQLHLINEQSIIDFCYCLLYEVEKNRKNIRSMDSKLISPAIIRQLWTFRNRNTSIQYIIDHTLQNIMQSNISSDSIFEDNFTWNSDIHPLVLSAIIAVCGGFRVIYGYDVRELKFSLKHIYNNSSILEPIKEYILNTKQSHCIKIQILIDRYENILRKFAPTDTSADIVDTFVALICLRGLTNLSIYEQFSTYQAFSLAIHRFERILIYLTGLYNITLDRINFIKSITSEVEIIVEEFFSHSTQYNGLLMEFSFSCAAALQTLQMGYAFNLSQFAIYRNRNIDQYLNLQPETFDCRKDKNREYSKEILNNIQRLQMLQNTPYFFLTFLPQSLQNLYQLLVIKPIDQNDSLPLVILLSESLIFIESIRKSDSIFYCGLSILKPFFEQTNLDIYASVFFYEENFPSEYLKHLPNQYPCFDLKMYYNFIWFQWCRADLLECPSDNRDLQFFATAISFARVLRACYSSQTDDISEDSSKIIYSSIENINNPVLQILALSTILALKEPLVVDEEQQNNLKSNISSLLKDLPECIPLLTATVLFVRCYPVRQFFPKQYPQILNSIVKQLNLDSIDQQIQQAVYLALRTLNNPDLSHSLCDFEKRTKNLSDLCEFNSTVFFRYFIKINSFELSNVNLLSSMYLAELSYDVEILKTFTCKSQKERMTSLTELHRLLCDPSTSKTMMNFEVATWIDNNLPLANRHQIVTIIKWISNYFIAEKEALSVLQRWLQYRTDESRKFFARYAALQLVKDSRNSSDLIEIIEDIFDGTKEFFFEIITKDLLEFENIDLTKNRQIFLIIIQGAYRLSWELTATIRCKHILDLILELEFQRIQSNMNKKTNDSLRSYLSMINICSSSVQIHLCNCINEQSKSIHPVQSYYLASILQWMISSLAYIHTTKPCAPEVFECFYRFLYDAKHPLVQKAIIIGFNRIFFSGNLPKEHVLIKSDVMHHLEQFIHSHETIDYAHRDDLLAASLLAYGNGLLRLQRIEINYIVPEETGHLLKTLSQRSSSELISIRANLCYLFSRTSNATRSTIFSSIKEQSILLQQTLYKLIDHDFQQEMKIITEYLKTCPSIVLEKFIVDLYNDLEKMNSFYYLSDYIPNYLNIVIHFIQENFDLFLRALQACTFDERNFKKTIYNAYQRTHNEKLIVLYGSFGIITKDLVNMLTYEKDSWSHDIRECIGKIKKISDRNAVEQLFNVLETTFHSDLLALIIQLAKLDLISLLEVHQRVSVILTNSSNKNNKIYLIFKRRIFDHLMNLSCIQRDNNDLFESEIESFIPERIHMESMEQHLYSNKSPPLFLRRTFFLATLHSK